jgi:hypothetical protein
MDPEGLGEAFSAISPPGYRLKVDLEALNRCY